MIDKKITLDDLKKKAPKGEFLAYINREEAAALKRAGGSGHLVNGIPSFIGSDYSTSSNSNKSGYQGGNRGKGGYQGSTGETNKTKSEGGSGSGNFTDTSITGDLSSDTQQYNHYEAMNQYNPIKEDLLPGDVPQGFIKPEDAVKLGLNLRPYEQKRVDLLNTPYQPKKMPFVPFISTPINLFNKTFGKIGYDKNLNFFVNNVAGKYGYNMTMGDFEKYMRDRGSGKVGAYGNENMGQNAINARAGGDDGIMDVYSGDGEGDSALPDDPDDQTDDFIFRYFDKTGESLQAGAGGVEDLMTQIRKRISNIFS